MSSKPREKPASTRVVCKELNPVWNEDFDLETGDIFNDSLQVGVFDKDMLSDDVIGNVSICLRDLVHVGVSPFQPPKQIGASEASWYGLAQVGSKRRQGKKAGEVELKIEILRPPSPSEYKQWLLTVAVCQARGLAAKDRGGTSDPYAVLSHGKQQHKTKVISKNLNPVWNERFLMIIDAVGFRPVTPLVLSVLDKDIIGSDDAIGDTALDLEHILATILPPLDAASGEHHEHTPQRSQTHRTWVPIFEDAARRKRTGEVYLELTATERLVFRPGEAGNLSVSAGGAAARLGHGAFFEILDDHGNAVVGTGQGGQEPGPSVAHVQVGFVCFGEPGIKGGGGGY